MTGSLHFTSSSSSLPLQYKHVGGRTMRSQVVYQIQCVIDVHEGPKFQVLEFFQAILLFLKFF